LKPKYGIYLVYMLLVLLLNILYLAPPFLAASGDSSTSHVLYTAFAPLCHQLPQRSLCLIAAPDGSKSIGDCIQEDTRKVDKYTFSDSRGVGHEFAVCARDTAIYLAMLLGGLVYPFVRRVDDERMPPSWLFVLALVPIAIDGGLQFLGFYESTNFMRLLTGAIAGFAVSFYALPLLYYFIPEMKKAISAKKK
jgi:uncharacterized membrane protein